MVEPLSVGRSASVIVMASKWCAGDMAESRDSLPDQAQAQAQAQEQPHLGHGILVREFDFEFPATLDPVWVPGNPYRSHFFNGVSLTMPYLEPFLVSTMREAMALVDDEDLLADMRGFNGQEAQHYLCHRRLNAVLTNSGLPGLARVEARIKRSYEKLRTRSLRRRMAYSAGFESMTNGFTNWMIGKRCSLFANANPHITTFWLTHMVEEVEHKTVAFDAYQACFGSYWPRAFGVLHGSFGVLGLGLIGMFSALRQQDNLFRPAALLGVVKELALMTYEVGPYLLRALSPKFDPRQESEPEWVNEWVTAHANADPAQPLPLVDTSQSTMDVPFSLAANSFSQAQAPSA